MSKQPQFKSGAVKVYKAPADSQGGQVKIHAPEQQTSIVKKKEEQRAAFANPGEFAGKTDKLERMLEYWLGTCYSSFGTLTDICDHIIPRVSGIDYEIGGGMSIMHSIATSCIEKLDPIADKYNIDKEMGHQLSDTLKDKLFPDDMVDVTNMPAFDVLVALQSFYLFLASIEAHLFALQPTAQAAWDKEFMDAVAFVTEQIERIKAWTKQQMHSRGPQTLIVPCKQGVGLRDRMQKKSERIEKK